MAGRRKKPKKDDAPSKPVARQAGYRDWDNIIPGEPMAPQPYAEQSWQSGSQFPTQPQPQAPPAAAPQPVAPPQPQPAYQQPAPQYQQPAPQQQPVYQQPAQQQQPAYQQAPQQQQPAYQQAPQAAPRQQPMPGGPGAPGAAPVAPAAAVNPTDGSCIKCGAAFGQRAVCDGCGAGRTACQVCGTKIWAGALTCSAHSNATRR